MNEDDLMKQFEAFYKEEHPEEADKDIASKKFVNDCLKKYMNKVSEYVTSHVTKDLIKPSNTMNAVEALMALAAIERIVSFITEEIDKELGENNND